MIPLELTAAASAADTGIYQKILESRTTILIIPTEEIKAIMKIVKSLDYPGLLIKNVTQTITQKKQEAGILAWC